MSSSYLAPSSPLRALLWKDFQQVKTAVLMLTLGMVAFQIISMLGWTLLQESQHTNPLFLPLVFCGMAPIIAVMACVGLLIGQERQTGSWAWSSSLPQSWRQALVSKACVTFGASLLTVFPLAIAPAVLWSLGYRLPTADLWESVVAPGGVLVMMLELAVFLTVALLIFRDSLTGLIVGGVWTTVVQLGLVAAGTSYFFQWLGSTNRGLSTFEVNELPLLVAQIGVLLLGGVGALLWLFRWRWSYGQAAEIAWRRAGPAPQAAGPSIALPFVPRSAAGGELRMLLIQSFRSLWPIHLGIAAVAVVGHWFDGSVSLESSAVTTLLSALLIGATTFHGDHILQRYRFLADRGVSPRKLIAARSIPFVMLLGVLALYLFVRNEFTPNNIGGLLLLLFFMACTAAYLIGLLSSLCFDKVVFSLAAALMTGVSIGLLGTFAALSGFYTLDVFPGWYLLSAVCIVPLSLAWGVFYLNRLSRQWLIQDAPRLPREFAWLMPTLSLIPFLLPLLFGFLLLPNAPWQGVEPVGSLGQSSSQRLAVSEVILSESPFTEYLERSMQAATRDVNLHPATLDEANAKFGLHWKDSLSRQQVEQWLAEIEAALGLDRQDHSDAYTAVDQPQAAAVPHQAMPHINQQIRFTACLGFLLASRDAALAQRLWISNQHLQELNLTSQPAAADLSPHIFSYHVFSHMLGRLNDEQLASWGTASDIRSQLLPDQGLMTDQRRLALQLTASRLRDQLRAPIDDWQSLHMGTFPWPTRLIPTLRWRQERSLAWELQQALTAVDSGQWQVPPTLNLLRKSFAHWDELKLAAMHVESSVSGLAQ